MYLKKSNIKKIVKINKLLINNRINSKILILKTINKINNSKLIFLTNK